ncbi:MAG TPA: transposase [Candidatus Aphodousia faecigallinarum]|uniref:Transposase n=1 Tax=Candidatus Aphodousia faecigallinarum TaxID=2840677 RepID=A0A9D1LFQ6_9BURK|nr:transposase [Candidatus Aphodousia faecigallinarum]
MILTFLKYLTEMRIKMHKRFSEEFKKSAIIRVQNGESQLSVANSLGISYKTLNRWIIRAKGQMPSENVSLSEENARLRKALKEREAEIAFLKKQRRTSQRCRNEVRLP